MKWQGRKQSINFVDLRIAPKKLTIIWSSEESENWIPDAVTGVSQSTVTLGTDGVYYLALESLNKGGTSQIDRFTGAQEIKITVDDANYRPTIVSKTFTDRGGYGVLTSGQKNALRDVVKNMLQYVDKKNITLSGSATPEGVVLLGFVQAALNDN